MTFVDRPLPSDLHLPVLQTELRKTRPRTNIDNLQPRFPGQLNKISRDLKLGIIEGAASHGYDGCGEGGLHGYLAMCAARYPKHYLALLAKLLPLNIGADVTARHISTVNIVAIPHDSYLAPEDIARYSRPGHVEEHEAPIEHVKFEEAPMPEPRLTDLEARLNSLPYEKLLALAGVTDDEIEG